MPDPRRVRELIAAVERGAFLEAIASFYHPDASMQENDSPPRVGRDVLLEHEGKILDQLRAMRAQPGPAHVVDGDRVAIHWTFEATDRSGVTRRLEEVALQTWRGDRIAQERFFYDTATAWRVVEESGPAAEASEAS